MMMVSRPRTKTGRKVRVVRNDRVTLSSNGLSSPPSNHGFTLVELMVALSIAAVLMVYAIPAFNDFANQRRMSANVNLLISAISFARSTAVTGDTNVTVQTLEGDDNDNEWGGGFCVTYGNPGHCDDPLRVFDIEGAARFDGTQAYDKVEALSFDGKGLLVGQVAGQIELCGDDTDEDPGRLININALGRTNVVDLTCYP